MEGGRKMKGGESKQQRVEGQVLKDGASHVMGKACESASTDDPGVGMACGIAASQLVDCASRGGIGGVVKCGRNLTNVITHPGQTIKTGVHDVVKTGRDTVHAITHPAQTARSVWHSISNPGGWFGGKKHYKKTMKQKKHGKKHGKKGKKDGMAHGTKKHDKNGKKHHNKGSTRHSTKKNGKKHVTKKHGTRRY
jgi:hypothetical protein